MIKVKVIEDFSLTRYNEIKNIVRATSKNEEGYLYVGDIFECNQDLVDYLSGNNRLGRAFVEAIEIIPEVVEKPVEKVEKKETKKTTTKKSTTTRKKVAKK